MGLSSIETSFGNKNGEKTINLNTDLKPSGELLNVRMQIYHWFCLFHQPKMKSKGGANRKIKFYLYFDIDFEII